MKHFKVFLTVLLLFFSTSSFAIIAGGLGNLAIVSNNNNATISIVDPLTGTSYGPFLAGSLPEDDIYEIKVTPDGKTALLAAFYERKLYFLDITNPTSPSILGSTDLSSYISPGSIAISPNGKCAIIGDGSSFRQDKIPVIDINSRTVVDSKTVNEVTDISISPDGSIVLASSFYENLIRVFHFNQNNCTLSDTGKTLDTGDVINTEFSPDGKTVVALNYYDEKADIFRVDNPTTITKTGTISFSYVPTSAAFYGNKVYVHLEGNPDKFAVLEVNGPGNVSDTGTRIDLGGSSTIGFFGVNQVAITPDGKYAVVSHEGNEDFVSVVDITANTFLYTVTTDKNAISVATVPVFSVSPIVQIENGKMYGNFTIGNWPNSAVVNSQIPCSSYPGVNPIFTMNWVQNYRYNYIVAYNLDSVVCYDDPAFDPIKPNVDFDTTIATLRGMMNYSTPVIIEIEESDGGEPGRNRDYVHITVKDMSNTVIFETDGMVTSGSVYAMPLHY